MAFDRRETALLLVGDFLILVASLWAALLLRNLEVPSWSYFELNLVPFLPLFIISLVVFYIAGLYDKQTRPIRRVMGVRILGAQATNVTIGAILFFTLPLGVAPKTILVLYLVLSVIAESLWRFYRMRHELAVGVRTPALLVGTGPAVSELHDEVNGNTRLMVRFISHVETKALSGERLAAAIEDGIARGAKLVIVDRNDPAVLGIMDSLYALQSHGASLIEFSSFYEEIFDRVPLEHLDSLELLDSLPKRRAAYDAGKRAFDILLALLGSIVALPFICIGIAGRALTRTPVFFLHKRVGRGGKPFTMIKLASMLLNDHGDPELQKENRVTAFGRFLRKTRIDELPQLWNVLVGDLSFIGPRPELPKIAEVYEREIPQYRMRHLIAPGLSGWAQIHDYDAPRGGADVAKTRKKLSLDLYYLKHRSFGLDLAIAAKTLRALASFSGT